MSSPWRSPPRPAEIATMGSALFVGASALLPAAEEHRGGLLVAAAAVVAYSIVWYRVLPARALGTWRYEIAGTFIQLIGLFTISVTGGVSSDWFAFYLLPVIATVFSYRPRTTGVVSAVAAAGIGVLALLDPQDSARVPEDVGGTAILRLVELAAVAVMALLVTRAMRRQRADLLAREGELREALQATEREALTDPLTGVHNRRSLEHALAAVASRAERGAGPYSILLVDVDHLKQINDRAGHAAGDTVLGLVARAAVDAVRAYDVVARFGGDEFVVVVNDATAEAAQATAMRIEQRFAQLLKERPELGATDISLGTATWRPGRNAAELLTEADELMYAAKRARRQK